MKKNEKKKKTENITEKNRNKNIGFNESLEL